MMIAAYIYGGIGVGFLLFFIISIVREKDWGGTFWQFLAAVGFVLVLWPILVYWLIEEAYDISNRNENTKRFLTKLSLMRKIHRGMGRHTDSIIFAIFAIVVIILSGVGVYSDLMAILVMLAIAFHHTIRAIEKNRRM